MAYRPETVSFIFSRQPNNSLIAASVNRMLTVLSKTCFESPFLRALSASGILTVNPHKYAVCGGFQRTRKRPKGTREHLFSTTRNAVAPNGARGFESHLLRHSSKIAVCSLSGWRFFYVQNVFHRVGRLYFALVGKMRVNIRRGGKGAVPQPFLNGFHGNACRQQ